MPTLEEIEVHDSGLKPPRSYGDIQRYLEESADLHFETAQEIHERLVNPNRLALRDMLGMFGDTPDILLERITAMAQEYVSEGMEAEEIRRYIQYAARGLTSPESVVRAIDKAFLIMKHPDIERRFGKASAPGAHRAELEEFVKHRHSLEPLRLNIDAIDASIPGGIGFGEVLHIVGGEGGQKTSLALHALTDYAQRGGKALFLSLDMSPRFIEVRLLMRLLNCSKRWAFRHIEQHSAEYREAVRLRAEIDENLRILGGPMTLPQIEAAILASDVDVVALDYVSIVSGFKDELSAAREVSAKIRQWRNRWGLIFVLLSQMSRESMKDQRSGGMGGHAIGGSSLEQTVDYEIEMFSDAPLIAGEHDRLIARLRKNRNGPKQAFELYPLYPSIDVSDHADLVDFATVRKPLFRGRVEF